VEEAIHDGLDVIAITDHIEYRVNTALIKGDHNKSYDISRQAGDKLGLLVIKGAEITRNMPPGHLNALFITDANKLEKNDFMDAIEEAEKQNAFIVWNHPGWKFQQPDTVKWFDIHTQLLQDGMLDGIEVCNYTDYYPMALDWAIEKGLCIFANSDVHNATAIAGFNKHRPVTLVFATANDAASVREALDSRRTACWFGDSIMAVPEVALALLQETLKVNVSFNDDGQMVRLEFRNLSSCPIVLKPGFYTFGIPEIIKIDPFGTQKFSFSRGKLADVLEFDVLNYITSSKSTAMFNVKINQTH